MEQDKIKKNLYDLKHQRIINGSNIIHIVLATILISFLFSDLPLNKNSIYIIKIEAIMLFLVIVLIMNLIIDRKIKKLESKISSL